MTAHQHRLSPLAGLRVLEVGGGVAAAMCGRLLGGLGAEVVLADNNPDRFSEEGGDAAAVRYFLDEAKVQATATLADWKHFDVLLITGQLSAEEKDQVAREAPHLVTVLFSVMGNHDPENDGPATELTAQAASGLLAMLGRPDRVPLMLPPRQLAYSSGCMGFSALMTALAFKARKKDDARGQVIEISDLETAAYIEWKGPVYYQASGQIVPRGRETGPVVVPCANGHLALYYNQADWPKIKTLLGNPLDLEDERFAAVAGRLEAEAELLAIFARLIAHRSKHELYHAAQALGLPVGSVETVDDLLASQQYAIRAFLTQPTPHAPSRPELPFTLNGRRPEATAATTPILRDQAHDR